MATRTKSKATKAAEPIRRVRPADLPAGVNALLTRRDVCAALRVSERTLGDLMRADVAPFPRGRQFGGLRQPRWTIEDVNGWIEANVGGASDGIGLPPT